MNDFNIDKKPNLRASLLELVHCRNSGIDTVVADCVAGRVAVRFEWKGFIMEDPFLIGEFNGWRPGATDL